MMMMMMVVDKEDDVGLNLTLGFSNPNTTTTNNTLPLISSSPSLSLPPFHFSDRTSSEAPRSFLKWIDVNRLAGEEDDPAAVSSPNSTISSSVSGKRSPTAGEDPDEEDGETSRKKLRLSKDQSAVLEQSFKQHSTLNPKQKSGLANRLGLRPRQVEVWFQNRRARTKLKQTEVDCEFLKRCCEQLTEDNRRLQKEVQELRALKLSPQFYMRMAPATTLTMCPSCERVGDVDAGGQGRRFSEKALG